jgi:hypothetical protein
VNFRTHACAFFAPAGRLRRPLPCAPCRPCDSSGNVHPARDRHEPSPPPCHSEEGAAHPSPPAGCQRPDVLRPRANGCVSSASTWCAPSEPVVNLPKTSAIVILRERRAEPDDSQPLARDRRIFSRLARAQPMAPRVGTGATGRFRSFWPRSSHRKEDPSVARKHLCHRRLRVALPQDDITRAVRASS